MKQIINIGILMIFYRMTFFAQQLEVISSSGGFLSNSNGSISFTLGECVTNTYNSPNLILTQGFQQPFVISSDIRDLMNPGIEMDVFPNPVKEDIILKVKDPRGLSYILYDMNGVILDQNDINKNETAISFENLVPAGYIIKVLRNKEEMKTFKIIKQ
jgi:hypothetical protein